MSIFKSTKLRSFYAT